MINQTYTQNWPVYDRAQCNEKTMFMPLLAELCSSVEQKRYVFGRPSLQVSDMLFCAVMKVYSSHSLRRFMGDMEIAHEKGYTTKVPCFASIGHFFQSESITPILYDLVVKSSLPLKSVEIDFAVDSSGFSTCRFARWTDFKYAKDSRFRVWVKAHITCGVKTNIITAVRLTEFMSGDSPHFKELMNETAKNFEVKEVSADKAYCSRDNYGFVKSLGGDAYIPFRSNISGKARGSMLWSKMYHYFKFHEEDFMKHYHKRSNVETTFHMIKTKFGDSVKSKTKTAQCNEVLCKILCHNLCVLIHELYELSEYKSKILKE